MRMSLRNLLLWGAAASTLLPLSLWGQTTAHQPGKVDLAITYAAQRSSLTPGQNFWRQGGTVELSAQAHHGFGIAMNITGDQASTLNGTGVGLDTVTTTFGPRYTFHRRKSPSSGQGLLGESHGFHSLFPTASGAISTSDTFALQVGGGIDYRLTHRLAIRPIHAGWVRTQFPNSTTNVQNNLNFGAVIVLRFH